MITFLFWLTAWITICWIVAKFCAFSRDFDRDRTAADVDTIRDELDSQEMRTRKVRAVQ